ncbi:MAG: LamG-like jellyroll fold domain-containing protein [Bacteroidota bacterium]
MSGKIPTNLGSPQSFLRIRWGFLFSAFSYSLLFAQQPLVSLSFSEGDLAENKATIASEEAVYKVDLMRQHFARGLTDYALDLSEYAAYRRPWVLDSALANHIETDGSFSVQVWVKTLPEAEQGTPIIGNKTSGEDEGTGWQIITQENGAWGISLSDGTHQIFYRPTKQQRINDGQWHQIVLSIERPKNESRMYFDGKAVAIYNLGHLGDVSSSFRTIIGGADEYFDWGSAGQWTAFNGYLDEVKIWNRSLSAQEVHTLWMDFFPESGSMDSEPSPQQLKVLVWNIWHGGRRYGQKVGVKRTIEILQKERADIVCLIETYGSGEKIADALGYELYLISSNLSILSRFPIEETIETFRPFNFGAAVVRLSPTTRLLVCDTWLHYLPDYLGSVGADTATAAKPWPRLDSQTAIGSCISIRLPIQAIPGRHEQRPPLPNTGFGTGLIIFIIKGMP